MFARVVQSLAKLCQHGQKEGPIQEVALQLVLVGSTIEFVAARSDNVVHLEDVL